MTNSYRLGTALTAIGLVGAITGCSMPSASGPRSASIFGEKVDKGNIGLATRALAALNANQLPEATALAERAVENSPRDAGFRALLGNIYLAQGRFASAEAAYHDSLTLVNQQPQVILKLALVQTAQGRGSEAAMLLRSAQSMLDSADLGLALALAGQPDQAIAVLDPAARQVGADARLRQNLALAHALSGDWNSARLVAAQDVPADQLDARIQQWMAMAKPGKPGAQVAAFIGIAPAASDSGQPVRLALVKPQAQPVRTAAAAPRPVAPVSVAAPLIVAPQTAPLAVAAPVIEYVAPPEPVRLAAAPVPVKVASVAPARAASIAPPAPVRVAQPVALRTPRPALSPAAIRLTQSLPEIRRAAASRNFASRSRAVVQLGAYDSRNFIPGAWSRLAGKYGALKSYTPVTARFDSPKGTFYRLAVKGFASDREAMALCASLKRSGAACFVRATSGDAPIRLASR